MRMRIWFGLVAMGFTVPAWADGPQTGGSLSLSGDKSVSFSLDGEFVGQGSVFIANPRPGARKVTFRFPNRAPIERTIEILTGATVSLQVAADGGFAERTERRAGISSAPPLVATPVPTLGPGCNDRASCLAITSQDVPFTRDFRGATPLRIRNTCKEAASVKYCFARPAGQAPACGAGVLPANGELIDAIVGSCGAGRVVASAAIDAASCQKSPTEVACTP